MDNVLTKRVSLVELFYDLVFVYMISRATGLIHHLQHGIVSPVTLAIFALVVIVFINSWMVQMVFTNRYGKSSWTNISFSFVDMAIVLYMSNAFTATFDRHLATFFTATGLLSLTLCLQYLIVYHQARDQVDRQISRTFALILGLRTVALLIGGLSPNGVGITIALIGIIVSWIGPAFTGKYTRHRPIIFSHLLERLTALIILMFGETIVGIADYFTQANLSIFSILIFVSVVNLFFTYIVEFDHLIDEHHTKETGNLMIYLHYFILFGISLFTVALKFISEENAQPLFTAACLFGGLGLFYIGLVIANHYNRIVITKPVMACFAATTVAGFVIALARPTFAIFTATVAIVTLLNAAVLTAHLLKNN